MDVGEYDCPLSVSVWVGSKHRLYIVCGSKPLEEENKDESPESCLHSSALHFMLTVLLLLCMVLLISAEYFSPFCCSVILF